MTAARHRKASEPDAKITVQSNNKLVQFDPLLLHRHRDRPREFMTTWSPVQRLEWVHNCSLDNLEWLLNLKPLDLDPEQFRAWKDATLSVFHIGAKFGLQRARTDDAEHLAEVKRRLQERVDQG